MLLEGKNMIGVIAKIPVAKEKAAEFEAAANDLIAKVRANEPGCLLYELFKSQSEEGVYIFMEKYENAAAIAAHGKTEYFLAAQPLMGSFVTGAPDIQLYDAV